MKNNEIKHVLDEQLKAKRIRLQEERQKQKIIINSCKKKQSMLQ